MCVVNALCNGGVQIIGLFEYINIPFSATTSVWIQIGAVAELNFEILQHQCIFEWTTHAFYSNVKAYFWLPIGTAIVLVMVYGAIVLVYRHKHRRLMPQRRKELLTRVRQRVIALGCCLFNLMYAPLRHTNH